MSTFLQPGRSVGPYIVRGVVGQGDHATVYRVRDERSGSDHALKVFREIDARRRLRIEQEVVLGNRLEHTNVVAATAVLDVDGQPALLMDLVGGPSLDRWLHSDGSDDLATRLRVFRGVVVGCGFAHRQGVVHRGLKPSNVVLHATERDGRTELVAKVTDFGLAKALAPEVGKFGGLTTLNTSLGAPGYTAPEQSRDASTVDARADVYSLGCLLYELLCGIGPFSRLSSLGAIQAQREGRFRDPREFVATLPEELRLLVVRMLQADPAQRPQSCGEVLDVLDEVLVQLGDAGIQDDRAGALGRGDGLELGTLLALCGVPAAGMLLGSAVVFLL